MDDNVINLNSVKQHREDKKKEIAGCKARLEELKAKEYMIKKEIQMAEFLIRTIELEINSSAVVNILIKEWINDTPIEQ